MSEIIMSESVQTFDIAIAGGGLAGCLTALSLANLTVNNKPLSIAIVEANTLQENNQVIVSSSFDSRVLALSHGSAQYLKTIGAWQYLQEAANPIETIHISDRGQYGKARIYAKEHQVDALGYVAEMQAIGQSLLKALASYNNITWFSPDHIENIEWRSEHVEITLTSQQQISAALLLACDGVQSVCRQKANIKNTEKSYNQAAIITNIETQQPHNNVAYERFTEHGPIAVLPLTNNRCSIVWTMPQEQADIITTLDDNTFSQQLEQAFGYWLGGIKRVGERVTYPLKLLQAQENVFHRMALIGNASHTIHPIAGQGFNLGLRDIQTITQLITKQIKHAEEQHIAVNLGCFNLLNTYAQQRNQDQQSIIQLTDSLVTLFSNDLLPLVAGRNIGLKVLNYCQPLKQAFVNKTMGY